MYYLGSLYLPRERIISKLPERMLLLKKQNKKKLRTFDFNEISI